MKPILLSLYSKYYIPLGDSIKPCLKGLLLALLPGLEEEGNEHFDKVIDMFDAISKSVGTPFFYQSLALAMISVSHWRVSGLAYILRRLHKFESLDESRKYLGDDRVLFFAALSVSLEDGQILVQRGALDLLVSHFPLKKKCVFFES